MCLKCFLSKNKIFHRKLTFSDKPKGQKRSLRPCFSFRNRWWCTWHQRSCGEELAVNVAHAFQILLFGHGQSQFTDNQTGQFHGRQAHLPDFEIPGERATEFIGHFLSGSSVKVFRIWRFTTQSRHLLPWTSTSLDLMAAICSGTGEN